MAKKKKNENTLSYLQMPLPEGAKYSKMTKVSFGGLNKRYTLDSGEMTMEKNISTNEFPYLTPSEKRNRITEINKIKLKYYLDTQSKVRYPISMAAFDDFLVIVYYEMIFMDGKQNYAIMVDYITEDDVHTGIVKDYKEDESSARNTIFTPRSILQFNVYDTPTDPVAGQYVKKLLFFPDKASMFMRIEEEPKDYNLNTADTDVLYFRYIEDDVKEYFFIKVDRSTGQYIREEIINGYANCFVCDGMDVLIKNFTSRKEENEDGELVTVTTPPESASHNYYYFNTDTDETYRWVDDASDSESSGWKVSVAPAVPDIKYATVHLSRVFGVDDDRVYASGYNNYANWNLDTIDEYNESNAWCSPSQSNTKADGQFTGITTFQNHVICFKRDFMHEIYNTKNPFRLQDIYAEGTIDNRTIQDVDGKLIFVSEDDVKIYTGSNPRVIGYKLNMLQYKYAVSGTDNRSYYLYCENDVNGKDKHLYVYDTLTELWSEQSIDSRVISFAHNKNGMYMLCEDGYVYQMDSGDYSHEWSFETDLITNKTVDIKHIKKLQMLVDVPETINDVSNQGDETNPTTREAYLEVFILYDDEVFEDMKFEERHKRKMYSNILPGEDGFAYLSYDTKKGRLPIRVKPRKTANYGFKLHIEGAGYVKLYELEIFVEQGGAMYV